MTKRFSAHMNNKKASKNHTAKALLSFFLAFAVAITCFQLPTSAAVPSITAEAAVVMDHDTGEILYEKAMNKMMVPASMTKIMTAYIIFEEIEAGNLTLDSQIKVSSTAAAMSRNSNYPMAVPLTSGASYSVDTLLELIMVPSASASCYAVAEHISGSEAAFVARMNETAKKLGMTAEFKNSHGAQVHYVTAKSIALLIHQFIDQYPAILDYTSLKSITFNGATYANTNQLLTSNYYYEGADGFKTGTIAEAGYCLSSTALRDGRRIIGVVMKSTSTAARHTDSQKILNYGFEQIAAKDASRSAANVDLKLDEIRLNADAYMTATFNDIETAFQADAAFTVNGEVVKEFKGATLSNGITLIYTHCFYASENGSEAVGFYYTMPDGSKREWHIDVPVSDAPPAMFKDIHQHWAEKEIESLCNAGLFSGSTKDYFDPSGKISLGMLLTVLGRYAESSGTAISAVDSQLYYAKYMAWASSNGLLSDTGADPDATVSRSELATILYRFAKLEGGTDSPTTANVGFSDISGVSDEARQAIEYLVGAGIVSGYEDHTFRPDNEVSRAELVYILDKYIALSE